ncbi:P1 family peptidase [Kiloniella laminariae]|uniref:P1 family peptidase n=1 Tax=Kiloniella laminariae TaxID=454162 RepID=A0ABT4LDF2_9PROT|nr:P1 family peptidase [Kiloniella laminariae]MCZ4279139.1 P1 family peptidase [Kiloniella laminariae]
MSGFPGKEGWWRLPPGSKNTVCDVPGVLVGHQTLHEGEIHTGVTAICPHGGNIYRDKVRAGLAVLNGFGKSAGLLQLAELGQIETPIILTNTFGVSAGIEALVRRAITENPDIGRKTATVNPVVMECNDGWLNDIQRLSVTEDMVNKALHTTAEDFAQGAVGAGAGMKTFGFAGGVGSASRKIICGDGTIFTLGCLVLSNFGVREDLRICGEVFEPDREESRDEDKGSIILVFATDAPLDARQLGRLCRRSSAALGRLGSVLGNQSGDIALAFSTAGTVSHDEKCAVKQLTGFNENDMNAVFYAAVESAENAVLNSLWHSSAVLGRNGHKAPAFREAYELLNRV